MAMVNMNLIGVFVTKCMACTSVGATKNIISLKFSNFGDINIWKQSNKNFLSYHENDEMPADAA